MEIKINGRIYQCTEETTMFDTSNIGKILPVKQQIYINKDMHVDEKNDTLLHEIIHSIDVTNQLGMTEQQVTSVASNLFNILRENGYHIDFFKSEEK